MARTSLPHPWIGPHTDLSDPVVIPLRPAREPQAAAFLNHVADQTRAIIAAIERAENP